MIGNAAIGVCVHIMRVQLDGFVVVFNGFFMLTTILFCLAPIVIGFGKLWISFYGFCVVFDSVLVLFKTVLGVSPIVIGFGKIWV